MGEHYLFTKIRRGFTRVNVSLREKKVLLQVSGGPDSIFLMHAIHWLYGREIADLMVLTIDFRLRGTESKRETEYVQKLCEDRGIPCHAYEADPRTFLSIQRDARRFRIEKAEEVMRDCDIDYTLLGHHLDDRLETAFLKMGRSGGIFSLSGFSFRRGKWIRPLLEIRKREILTYLKEHEMVYFSDSTNTEDIYLRNRLRKEVFPRLSQALPGWERYFSRSLAYLRQASALLQNLIERSEMMSVREKVAYFLRPFFSLDGDSQRIVLHHYFLSYFPSLGVSTQGLETSRRFLVEKRQGSIFFPGGMEFECDRQFLYFKQRGTYSRRIRSGDSFTVGKCFMSLTQSKEKKAGFEENEICFSAPTPIRSAEIRSRRPGDRLLLPGGGSKKIKDLLIDYKIPRFLRDSSLILEAEKIVRALFFTLPGWLKYLQKLGEVNLRASKIIAADCYRPDHPYGYRLAMEYRCD